MNMKPRLLFIILAVASLFSIAYVTGLIKETRYVKDTIVQEAKYDKTCMSEQAVPGAKPRPSWAGGYEKCLIKEATWGYGNCDFNRKAMRIKHCFGIQEFSPIKAGVLVLVSLTGLMYFKIRKQ